MSGFYINDGAAELNYDDSTPDHIEVTNAGDVLGYFTISELEEFLAAAKEISLED
nr:MAG TPA: hypothetical protein [Caudoviricetes sp.]